MIKMGPRKIQHPVRGLAGTFVRDDIYVDQKVVRQDYTENSKEGEALVSQIKAAYPDYGGLPNSRANIVGSYGSYREPYQGDGISFYNLLEKPTNALLEQYGVSQPTKNLQPWYGLKFDLSKDEVIFKCVVKSVSFAAPDLPDGSNTFYATTHTPDKAMSDWVDYYVIGVEPEKIKAFCSEKGLAYPLPENLSAADLQNLIFFGFVFNKSTMEYGAVKGYIRVTNT